MTEFDDGGGETVRGRVKWFDPGKGYGFIVADDGGPDILLHANVLRTFGQNSLADGTYITARTQATECGVQANEVLEIVPPEAPEGGAGLTDLEGHDPADIAARPLEPARVKWFDKAKGFGFANVFGQPDDIFIHIEVLRQAGLADLAPGEAVCMRVIDGRRGKLAAEVLPWDIALRAP